MSKTARGIYHNLENSEYTVTVNGTVYFFSSLLYMAKFEHELESNREKLEKTLTKQNLQFLYCDELADYQLYVTIEKRGFCIGEPYDNENIDKYNKEVVIDQLVYIISLNNSLEVK